MSPCMVNAPVPLNVTVPLLTVRFLTVLAVVLTLGVAVPVKTISSAAAGRPVGDQFVVVAYKPPAAPIQV